MMCCLSTFGNNMFSYLVITNQNSRRGASIRDLGFPEVSVDEDAVLQTTSFTLDPVEYST